MIAESTSQLELLDHEQINRFPEIVRRSYERGLLLQRKFSEMILSARVDLPERSCICLSGSASRLESVEDSDIDYVLLWDERSSMEKERLKARTAVAKINNQLASNSLRPCDSFSCDWALGELLSTENLFSRYSILTLLDSTFMAGNQESYEESLNAIKFSLADYAIGISAETQVIRSLVWYIQREGWIDQLRFGTSVNRFSRLIQLFATIFSINQFGIDSTRDTKTTWTRIEKLEPHLPCETTSCLKKLWLRALELKENRALRPMLQDSGFTGVSQLMETWDRLLALSYS
ncbi:MAG: DUF294 nucleotidyltransferase-like domain-containing protein [Nitrososphaerales archaeon]